MVARGPGAVGCAHCTLIGADRACQICTRLVCEACGSNWTTCSEPSGRVVRLGLTARVRDVDPTGNLALVSHWRKPLRLFDLRQLRWIDGVHVPRTAWLLNRRNPPRLDSRARVTYADWSTTGEAAASFSFLGLRRLDLRTNTAGLVLTDALLRGAAMTASGDRFYFVSTQEQVVVVDGGDIQVVDPLPRKVIHAVHLDAERNLLASGSWSELALHRIVDGKLHLLGHRKTTTTGDVSWLAVAGAWLVAGVYRFGGGTDIELFELGTDDTIAREHRHSTTNLPTGVNLRAAALARDGRYLALAIDDHLLVRELGTDNTQRFDEHTDRINLVRFAGDDHLLVTADTDNRVVLRPRTKTGYATPLVAIDIPDDGVPLPQQTRASGM